MPKARVMGCLLLALCFTDFVIIKNIVLFFSKYGSLWFSNMVVVHEGALLACFDSKLEEHGEC